MLTVTRPPTIHGLVVPFDAQEIEAFFVLRKHRTQSLEARRRIMARQFSKVLYRRALQERVVRIVLDYYHDALALRLREVEALYRGVVVQKFSLRRNRKGGDGHYTIRLIYRVDRDSETWLQIFHFNRTNTSICGGLQGMLTSAGRRLYAE